MTTTTTKKKSGDDEPAEVKQKPKLVLPMMIAGLVVFDTMPVNRKPGKPDSNFYCSYCQWLILPDDRFRKKQFAKDIWLAVHSECSEKPEFKKKLEEFEKIISDG